MLYGEAKKNERHVHASTKVRFVGPSGTGNVMTASLFVEALRLDLSQTDFSTVANKYIR